MANSGEEFGRAHNGDEFSNQIGQPAIYSNRSKTDDNHTYGKRDVAMGGQQQQQQRRPVELGEGYDPTQRRGTTTGEYGLSGAGFVDRAKEKLADVGGFKEDPGHTTTAFAGGDEDGGELRGFGKED